MLQGKEAVSKDGAGFELGTWNIRRDAQTDFQNCTPFSPLLRQVEQTVSALCQLQPATAVGQKALALAKRRYSTVCT